MEFLKRGSHRNCCCHRANPVRPFGCMSALITNVKSIATVTRVYDHRSESSGHLVLLITLWMNKVKFAAKKTYRQLGTLI